MSEYPPLEDYGAIGNCRTLALVSRDGSIDWLCLPHFSGEAVFAALLDSTRGGTFRIRPRGVVKASHRYIDNTNVLETLFECETGRLRLVDFMTIATEEDAAEAPQPQHELVRIAECTEGSVELDALYQPRPGYARETPRLARRGRLGWAWMHNGLAAYLHSDFEFAPAGDGAASASAVLHAGETRHVAFTASENESVVIPPPGDAARRRLDGTIRWWQAWSASCRYQGPYRDAVVRSLLALKLLSYCLSGAVVAAPTTSLPVSHSGARNWDYRYCWLRDSAMVIMSFMELGFEWEATAFVEWLLHATKLTQPKLQVLYDLFGETRLHERGLAHLEGYRGIGPVRTGNAAHEQLQLDIYGEVVLGAYCYASLGGGLDRYERRLLVGFGEVVRKCWRSPDQSIWETRTPRRHYTYSKLMCWVALDRLLRLHEIMGLDIDSAAYRRECEAIRADIDAHAWNAQVNSYVGYYGGSDPDATLLLLARHEYIAPDDPRMTATCRYIQERLAVDGFIHRYPQDGSYDGIDDPENLFGACTLWLVEYLASANRLDEATELFERVLNAATDLGLYAEEFDVHTKGPVGNFPQAFTHTAIVRAAVALQEAGKAG